MPKNNHFRLYLIFFSNSFRSCTWSLSWSLIFLFSDLSPWHSSISFPEPGSKIIYHNQISNQLRTELGQVQRPGIRGAKSSDFWQWESAEFAITAGGVVTWHHGLFRDVQTPAPKILNWKIHVCNKENGGQITAESFSIKHVFRCLPASCFLLPEFECCSRSED